MSAPAYRPLDHPTIERRNYESTYFPAAAGKSYYLIWCPFCGAKAEARSWSLAGGGKRCECGAKHHWYGSDKEKE